jgi:hypothetical protein
MSLWKKFIDKIVGEDPEDQRPEPKIIALSRGCGPGDYPASEVRDVTREYTEAQIVIDVFGTVVKDMTIKRGTVNLRRPATQEEIRRAKTV